MNFSITSRSSGLLRTLASALKIEGYHPRVRISRKKGTVKLVKGREGSRWITLTEDIRTLTMGRKAEVKRLCHQVMPFSRHREKVAKMNLIVDDRNEDWAEMAPKFGELRRIIGLETKATISRAEIEYKARHGGLA